jgi:putative endonuclease
VGAQRRIVNDPPFLIITACYIIFSKKLNRFYIGVVHDDLNERINKHNDGSYGDHRFTAKATDWELFLVIETESFKQALTIEKHIKSMKSAVYIRNLSKYPEMIEKLKNS